MGFPSTALGRSSLPGFCVLAYALTWLCWLPLVLARRGVIALPASEEWLATVGQFGPFAAAVLCAAWGGGARGAHDLLRRFLIRRVRIRWFAVALLLPPVGMGCAILAHAVLHGLPLAVAVPSDLATVLPHLLITLVIGGPLGEEPGWRGFALPRLRARWHPVAASAVLGVLWVGRDPGAGAGQGACRCAAAARSDGRRTSRGSSRRARSWYFLTPRPAKPSSLLRGPGTAVKL